MALKANEKKDNARKYQTQLNEISDISAYKENMIKDLNFPCEHCGKLTTDASKSINGLKAEVREMNNKIPTITDNMDALEKSIDEMRLEYQNLFITKPKKPEEPKEIKELSEEAESLRVNPIMLRDAEVMVEKIETAEEELKGLSSSLDQASDIIKDLTGKNEQLKANRIPVDHKYFEACKQDYYSTMGLINETNSKIGQYSAEHKGLVKRLEDSKHTLAKIETIVSRLTSAQSSLTEWEKIEAAFSPKGLPAMELSLLAPIIDREANRLLETYGARFKVQTITQDMDSRGKNMIEKFKILVHDNQASEVKNLPVVSGGQGVWITKALQESISKVASNRTGRNWLYSIMDEADAALDTEIISDFYSMMDKAMDGNRKLISVSHSSEAKASIFEYNRYNRIFCKRRELIWQEIRFFAEMLKRKNLLTEDL